MWSRDDKGYRQQSGGQSFQRQAAELELELGAGLRF
jgi:hypothetical protein